MQVPMWIVRDKFSAAATFKQEVASKGKAKKHVNNQGGPAQGNTRLK